MPDETAKTVLQYVVDQAALARTRSAIKSLRAEQEKLVDEFNRPSTTGSTDALTKRMVRTRTELRAATDEAERLRQKLDQVDNGGTIGTSRLSRIGSELRMLPSIRIPGTSTGTDAVANVIRLAGAVDSLQLGFGKLAFALGAVGVVAVGFGLVLDQLGRQFAEAKRGLDAALAAQTNYYQALASLTTEQVQAEVERLQRAVVAQRAAANEADSAETAFFNKLLDAFTDDGQAPDAFSQASARAAFAVFGGDLVKASEQADAALAESEHSLNRFTQGLATNAFAMNDAAEAAENAADAMDKLIQAEERAAENRLRSRIQEDAKGITFARTGTPEAFTERINALNDERIAIERALPALAARRLESEEAFQTYKDTLLRLSEIGREFKRLGEDVPGAIQRLNKLVDEDIADINTKRDNAIKKAADDLADAQIENEDKKNKALRKLAEDQSAKRIKIENDFNRDFDTAVGDRDALAAFKAKQKRDDDLKELEADGKRRSDELDDQLQEQNAVAKKRYDQALQTAKDAATKEIAARQTAAGKVLQDLYAALNAETQMKAAANEAWKLLAKNGLDYINYLAVIASGRTVVQPNIVHVPQTGTAYENYIRYQQSQNAWRPVQGRAKGGPASGWTMTGEQGRELLYVPPNRGAHVFNNAQTERFMADGMGGGPKMMRLQLDGAATNSLLRGEAVDVFYSMIS